MPHKDSFVLVTRAGCVICKVPFGGDIVKGKTGTDEKGKPGDRVHRPEIPSRGRKQG